MAVYFARSLRGDRTPQDDKLYKDIVAAIKAAGHKTQFEIPVALSKDRSNDRYIFMRDLNWIDQCDAMIAEVTNPSHGVGYEIAYARHVRNMSILCVCQKDAGPVSAMIAGGLEVLYYRDIGDLTAYIQAFLAEIVPA